MKHTILCVPFLLLLVAVPIFGIAQTNMQEMFRVSREKRESNSFTFGDWKGERDFPQLPYVQTARDFYCFWNAELPETHVQLVDKNGNLIDSWIDIKVISVAELDVNKTIIPGTEIFFLSENSTLTWQVQVIERPEKRNEHRQMSAEIDNYGPGNIVILSSVLENGAGFELGLATFDQDEVIITEANNLGPGGTPGTYEYILEAFSAKFSFYAEAWPFLAENNTLRIRADLHLSEAYDKYEIVVVDQFRKRFEVANDIYEMNITSQNFTLTDGAIAPENGPIIPFTTDECFICGLRLEYYMPVFQNSSFYDPDFSILVKIEAEEEEEDDGRGNDGGDGGNGDAQLEYLALLSLVGLVVPIALCFMLCGFVIIVFIVPIVIATYWAKKNRKIVTLANDYNAKDISQFE